VCSVALIVSLLFYPSTANANDEVSDSDETYETVVKSYRVRPTDETTGIAETIDVSQEVKTVATVSKVLGEAVGVQVRKLGGLGSYSAASIRGSTSSQVPVFLDGVQLNAGGFPSVDLGDLNLSTFGEIEIYRGGAPVALGVSGIGGAVALKTRRFDESISQIALSFGSWNSKRIVVLQGMPIGKLQALTILTAQSADGDFEYLNQNGTLRNDADDSIDHRQNNAHIMYSGLLKLDRSVGDWDWTLLNDLFVKRHGVSGIGNIPTRNASLRTLRDTVTLRLKIDFTRRLNLVLEANYLGIRSDFDDLENEIGVGHQRTVSSVDTAAIGATSTVDWSYINTTVLRASTRYEVFSFKEIMQDVYSGLKRRVRTDIGLQHDWSPWRVLLFSPALRVEIHNTRYGGGKGPVALGTLKGGEVDKAYWSPSLGGKLEILSGLFLRANVGRYVRTPDIAELFGDRGAVVGNLELRPEAGVNSDVGIMYTMQDFGVLSLLRFNVAFFSMRAKDLIAYVQNSQNTVRPENIDDARILGGEAGFRTAFLDRVTVAGNYTYLYGINLSDKPYHNGKRLPGRPTHEVFGKVEINQLFKSLEGAGWLSVDYAGSNYLDQANFKEDALARLYFGVGARISHQKSGLSFTVEAKNIFNKITARDDEGHLRPLRDFEGFPLPGRTIFATLHWSVPRKMESKQ